MKAKLSNLGKGKSSHPSKELPQNNFLVSCCHEKLQRCPSRFHSRLTYLKQKLLELVVFINISVHFLTLEIRRCPFRHFLWFNELFSAVTACYRFSIL